MPEWCDENVVLDKYQQSDTGSITNDFDYEQSLLSNDIDIEMTPDESCEDSNVRPEQSQWSADFATMPEWCDENMVLNKHQQSATGSIPIDFESFSDLSIIANDEQTIIESEVYF